MLGSLNRSTENTGTCVSPPSGINSAALALMGRGPVAHNCPSLHEISSPQVQRQQTTQMKTLGLGSSSPMFSPCLYREQKPSEEMAKAQASLEAFETRQGRTEKQRNETDPRKTCYVLCLLGADSRLAWPR